MSVRKGTHTSPNTEFKKGHPRLSSLSAFPSGHIPWNKGKKGLSPNNKGKHWRLSAETRKKISEAKKGPKHPNWKNGVSKKEGYKAFLQRNRDIRKKGNGGSHTFGEWENLKAQYNWTCPCCHKSEPEIKLTQDHIIPIVKGGSDNIENIQPLCKSCNSRKKDRIIAKYEI